ncbi:MAG: AsmA family protein, partial [Rhodospirillaceae bacterium]
MLKKVLIGLVALVLIAIPVILIAPSLIDWNAYKARITSELAQATGRDVTIDGDLSLTLIPQPALSVDRVRLGNLDGGSRADMIRMGSMRINLQVAPLLSGQLVFDSIVLQQPDILLE